jgi:hypothetical protein
MHALKGQKHPTPNAFAPLGRGLRTTHTQSAALGCLLLAIQTASAPCPHLLRFHFSNVSLLRGRLASLQFSVAGLRCLLASLQLLGAGLLGLLASLQLLDAGLLRQEISKFYYLFS